MPRYVVLFPNVYYGRDVRPADPVFSGAAQDWARQFDLDADSRPTFDIYERLQTDGQRVMVCEVRAAGRASSGDDRAQEIWEATEEGYRDAARWARRNGVVAVFLGHGMPGMVELAPSRVLTVDNALLSRFEAVRRGRADRSSVEPAIDRVDRIGALLRAGHVARVDLLSCSVGVAAAGQSLVNGLHHRWRVPARSAVTSSRSRTSPSR